jgi:hypothetical protein
VKRKTRSHNPRWGSSLDDLLRAEGKFTEFQARALNEASALQPREAMRKKKVTRKRRQFAATIRCQ